MRVSLREREQLGHSGFFVTTQFLMQFSQNSLEQCGHICEFLILSLHIGQTRRVHNMLLDWRLLSTDCRILVLSGEKDEGYLILLS